MNSEDGTICKDGVVVEGTEGGFCANNQQCFFVMSCPLGWCQPAKLGESCTYQYHCPTGAQCDRESFTCRLPGRGEDCTNSVQCEGKLGCLPYKAPGSAGGLCGEV